MEFVTMKRRLSSFREACKNLLKSSAAENVKTKFDRNFKEFSRFKGGTYVIFELKTCSIIMFDALKNVSAIFV